MEDWKPVPGHIKTPWTDSIDPECPLPEYPRPQMVRQNWKNLNGLWKYGITGKEVTEISDYTGKILVPFAIESSLSGVKQPLGPEQKLWYCRSFQLPETWAKKRVLLHFEAVDWHCACYLNGNRIGDHFGGYVPFSFDITDHMNSGDNELVVTVLDPTDSHWQQKGKQVLSPHMIYYTATSGIWQTVWLEAVNPDNHIQSFRLTPDIDSAELSITVNSLFPGDIRISAFADKKKIGTIAGASDRELKMPVVTPRVWSPDDPFLYDLQVELLKEGVVVDSVESYFAMRKISITQGHSGRKRIFLNNQPIFLHGPLDQGYWPDSGMTPPCEDSMLFDIEKTKELGFNMTRKHIKVEPRRWYYHADRTGLIVIQDMISGGRNMAGEMETIFTMLFNRHKSDRTAKAYKKSWREEAESRDTFKRELKEVMDHLYNVPSLLMWVPFNESWGQFDAARVGQKVKNYDPTRLVDDTSGWFDQFSGDFASRHTYVIKLKKPPRAEKRIYFISEYGGYNYQEPGHLWDETSKFGYRMFKTRESLADAYKKLIRKQLIPLIEKGLGAAVYTQLSDVEIESNGFFTYDRKILKIDAQVIQQLNEEIYAAFKENE